jgi:hypothetical protein
MLGWIVWEKQVPTEKEDRFYLSGLQSRNSEDVVQANCHSSSGFAV